LSEATGNIASNLDNNLQLRDTLQLLKIFLFTLFIDTLSALLYVVCKKNIKCSLKNYA